MVEKFNLEKLGKYPVWVNIGRRKSGKSYLTKSLIYNYFHKELKYKFFMVISPTSHINDDYDYLDEAVRFETFNKTILDNILERQKKLIKEQPKGEHRLLVIFDDMANSGLTGDGSLFSGFIIKARHYRIAVIANYQAVKGLPEFKPIVRDNMDVLAVFQQSNYDNKLVIAKEWLSVKKGEEVKAIQIIEQIPNRMEHRALIIDIMNLTNDYKDFVFWYKAEQTPKNFSIKLYK